MAVEPTYEDLQVSLVLGRGVVIDTAPEYIKVSLGMLGGNLMGIRYVHGNLIRFAEQVEYEVTGFDPADCTLTLRLTHDWRPGQKDAPTS